MPVLLGEDGEVGSTHGTGTDAWTWSRPARSAEPPAAGQDVMLGLSQ